MANENDVRLFFSLSFKYKLTCISDKKKFIAIHNKQHTRSWEKRKTNVSFVYIQRKNQFFFVFNKFKQHAICHQFSFIRFFYSFNLTLRSGRRKRECFLEYVLHICYAVLINTMLSSTKIEDFFFCSESSAMEDLIKFHLWFNWLNESEYLSIIWVEERISEMWNIR